MKRSFHIKRLREDQDGAVLVEFALVLPIMLMLFGVTIEATRTFWSYQATIAGVRDATRYVSRVAETDVCADAAASLDNWQDKVTEIVALAADGTSLFPTGVTVTQVIPSLDCVTGSGSRQGTVPMATVTADLEITFPFANLFGRAGVVLPTVETTVSDTGRIFGV